MLSGAALSLGCAHSRCILRLLLLLRTHKLSHRAVPAASSRSQPATSGRKKNEPFGITPDMIGAWSLGSPVKEADIVANLRTSCSARARRQQAAGRRQGRCVPCV